MNFLTPYGFRTLLCTRTTSQLKLKLFRDTPHGPFPVLSMGRQIYSHTPCIVSGACYCSLQTPTQQNRIGMELSSNTQTHFQRPMSTGKPQQTTLRTGCGRHLMPYTIHDKLILLHFSKSLFPYRTGPVLFSAPESKSSSNYRCVDTCASTTPRVYCETPHLLSHNIHRQRKYLLQFSHISATLLNCTIVSLRSNTQTHFQRPMSTGKPQQTTLRAGVMPI